MNTFKNIIATLGCALLTPTAFAITDNQVFAYAEANFPSLFAGSAQVGHYEQYNYRYYPASDCIAAVDTSGVIFVLGSSCTGGALMRVGPVADFAAAITAWEATQATPPAAVNYSGTWSGNYSGFTFSYSITQVGNNLTLKSVPTFLTAQQTYTGTINGGIAVISTTDYAVTSATLTGIDNNTVRVVQDSCEASRVNAIYCMVPNGTSVTFTRQ